MTSRRREGLVGATGRAVVALRHHAEVVRRAGDQADHGRLHRTSDCERHRGRLGPVRRCRPVLEVVDGVRARRVDLPWRVADVAVTRRRLRDPAQRGLRRRGEHERRQRAAVVRCPFLTWRQSVHRGDYLTKPRSAIRPPVGAPSKASSSSAPSPALAREALAHVGGRAAVDGGAALEQGDSFGSGREPRRACRPPAPPRAVARPPAPSAAGSGRARRAPAPSDPPPPPAPPRGRPPARSRSPAAGARTPAGAGTRSAGAAGSTPTARSSYQYSPVSAASRSSPYAMLELPAGIGLSSRSLRRATSRSW